MRDKIKILDETYLSAEDQLQRLELEVQIDIRDQLTRIADYLQPQIIEGEQYMPPGFEDIQEQLDKIKI